MDTPLFLLAFLLCIVTPIALVITLIIWIVRRFAGNGSTPTPAALGSANHNALDTLDRLIGKWAAQGRLASETAAQVQALIAQERLAGQQPAAALIQSPEHEERLARQQPAVAPAALIQPPERAALPEATSAVAPRPAPAIATAGAVAAPRTPWGERMWDALLSLRTRQMLLFLGAFLLVISALVLVVFNWGRFSPVLQFALLAGVCGGLWGGGAWLARQSGLERAGAGLQAVGGVLVPVVAFSLSRPGLLDLEWRGAWLLASVLSLPIYILAAWRTRQTLFAVAGCLSAASAVLAALSGVESQWLPAALVITLLCYLPLANWLQRRASELAAGPYWVAHAGLPTVLLAAALMWTSAGMSAVALAITLWASTAFYVLALLVDRRPAWGWAAAAVPPVALLASLAALHAGDPWWGIAPAIMALGYFGLALALEPRARPFALPGYAGAAALAAIALAFTLSSETARWSLPLLLAGSITVVLAYHRGRFAWLAEGRRLALAILGLALTGALLPAWVWSLLELTTLNGAQQGLALLPLAALYLAGAYSWPGRVRQPYDPALQVLGVLLALGAGFATLLEQETWVAGMAALTAIWVFQTLLRRRALWAAVALGNLLLTTALLLARLDINVTSDLLTGVGLGLAALYLLGGTLLRRSTWSCWTWPAIGWGVLVAAGTLMAIALGIDDAGMVQWQHVGAVLAIAGLLALVAALWRAAWPGYVVATLLALATLLASTRGFFTAWQPEPSEFGYVLCAVTLGLALLGQGLRRIQPRYAYPYEIVGFALLTLAPIPTEGSPRHAALTWAGMALLYALACWRYRLRWAAAPALLAADMALLNGSAWLSPVGRPAGAGLLLLAAAWAQGLLGLWSSKRQAASSAQPSPLDLQPGYVVALLSGLGALALARGAADVLAIIAFGLAALLALLATAHRSEPAAWCALGLLALGFGSLHSSLGIEPFWNLAWGVAEALALCLLGWTIELRMKNAELRKPQTGDNTFSILNSYFSIWHRPLWLGPLLAGTTLVAALLLAAPVSGNLPPLTFALATLGLLLATLAVRRRELPYAYIAGAALIGAGLCQLYSWGFHEPQWYSIPSGLYLLALAEGLRRFQGQRKLSQVVEAGATMLLLGVTFGQSLRAEGLTSQLYALWLCCMALALLGYGTLRQLRVPFFGGAAFFVAGVLWLSVDPLLSTNKWVLLGILGLLLVGVYVLLERRQEQLARAGRAWVERVSGWG